ncbi:MAG: hypothetical protein RJA61_491 [Candidatus Parcubacteria bacterium]|jgi:penicillin-binding protein 1C
MYNFKNLIPKIFHKKKPSRVKKILITLGMWLGILCIFLGGFALLWISTFRIPDLNSFEERKVTQSTKIYDRTGKILLYDVFQNVKRTVVPFENISRHIKNATIAIEDAEFYEHGGIKPTAIIRAVLTNFLSGNLLSGQGGSTITQQVVKNSLLTNEKLISRKFKEWVLALKLEQVMDKDSILNFYLNEIPYGGSLYGVEEASQAFFGVKAEEVTLSQAAYLAALPQAPTYYSPYGKNKEALDKRKALILREMLSNNFINQEEYEQALVEKVEFQPQEGFGIKAPHFVLFVKDYLEKKYGQKVLEEGGLRVITTLDYELQKKGEELVKIYALENEKKFNASNAALVAVDPQTGGILTMVGSRDYFDKEIDGNFNVTLAKRQPGSAFKPFAYATAFSKGYTPETVLFDVKTEFSTECNPDGTAKNASAVCYMPQNYDEIYRGPISMRNALAQSINVPALQTLYLAGSKDTLRLAKDMGIQSLENVGRYGLTLVLGGGEVSPLDITSAYSVFANNGVRNPYTPILEIKDSSGRTLETYTKKSTQVLSKEIALQISDVLSDNKARTPAFGERSFLYFPGRDVAVKTGTTNDYKDAWIVGYTPNISVGAWAGNNDNSPMDKKVAGFIIAPLWNAFMNHALNTMNHTSFEKPTYSYTLDLKPVLRGEWQGGISNPIDKISGKRATEYTPAEVLTEKLSGGVHTILHWVDSSNPLGNPPTNPKEDSQYESWEYAVREWVKTNGISEQTDISLPTEYDDIHKPEFGPFISIRKPIFESVVSGNDRVLVDFAYTGKFSLLKADFYFNGSFVGSSTGNTFSFIPRDIGINQGINSIKVVVYDSVYNKAELETQITISNF